MSKERLLRTIKVISIVQLKKLRDTGIDKLILRNDTDIVEADRTELVTAINAKIIELGGTV